VLPEASPAADGRTALQTELLRRAEALLPPRASTAEIGPLEPACG